jgi:hypothetical protein
MNNKFDELTKSLAQSATRRGALKKFGIGLAGMALAAFGLANTAEAGNPCNCVTDADCTGGNHCTGYGCCPANAIGSCCCENRRTHLPKCSPNYSICSSTCKLSLP